MKILFRMLLGIMLALCFTSAFADNERGVTVKGKNGAQAASGKVLKTAYYALIIGNNDYRQLPKLKTAVNDAKEVNRVLSEKYGFKTKLLVNATRKDILTSINEFRKTLSETDSFLIYYAGHGEFDKTADKGYWLPVDAAKDDPVDWIMAEDITSNIKRILAKHVLILSDSCYSGSLTRSVASDLRGGDAVRSAFLTKMMERSSRTLMASGGNEPVADSGGRNDNSVFASAILMALQDSDKKTFTAEELFHGRVKEIVAGKSDQVPEYNNIRNSGHEGGDFIFQVAQVGGEEKETNSDAGVYEIPAQIAPADKKLKTQEGEAYTDPETGMEFVLVRGGCFQMGDTFGDGKMDEKPVHERCVGDYYIGKYEVTQGQWEKVQGNNPSHFDKCGDKCPVESVSWNDAQEFIRIMKLRTGLTYRLPTEAEWEYAARSGGKNEKYSGGDDPDGVAWYGVAWYVEGAGTLRQTHSVGQKRSNGLGLYDMSGNVGNVREWCQDFYDGSYYKNSPKDNPQGPSSGGSRVLRGGSWRDKAARMRVANRDRCNPGTRHPSVGFRLARTR